MSAVDMQEGASSGQQPPSEWLPPSGSGRQAWQDGIRLLLKESSVRGWREWIWLDESYLDWPLGDRSSIASLTHWASSHRRLTLMARNWKDVVRMHARWVTWRQQFDHLLDVRTLNLRFAMPKQLGVGAVIWTPEGAWQALDEQRKVLLWVTDPVELTGLRVLLDEIHAAARQGGFSANVLGL